MNRMVEVMQNIGLNPVERILEKYQELCIPWMVHFELTHRCNFRCIHCYTIPEKSENELNISEIKRIICEFREIGAMGLAFSGGEIFLRSDLLDILDYASQRHLVFLLTNGSLITRKIAFSLKEIGIYRIEISLYGNRKVHDMVTGIEGYLIRL